MALVVVLTLVTLFHAFISSRAGAVTDATGKRKELLRTAMLSMLDLMITLYSLTQSVDGLMSIVQWWTSAICIFWVFHMSLARLVIESYELEWAKHNNYPKWSAPSCTYSVCVCACLCVFCSVISIFIRLWCLWNLYLLYETYLTISILLCIFGRYFWKSNKVEAAPQCPQLHIRDIIQYRLEQKSFVLVCPIAGEPPSDA